VFQDKAENRHGLLLQLDSQIFVWFFGGEVAKIEILSHKNSCDCIYIHSNIFKGKFHDEVYHLTMPIKFIRWNLHTVLFR